MRTRPTFLMTAAVSSAILLGACASTTVAKTTTAITKPATSATSVAGTAATPAAPTTPAAAAKVAPTTQGPETVVAGDIPDNQAFVAFTPAAGGYTIRVPEGWARSSDGAATVFSDKFNTIRVESVPLGSAPTAASVIGTDLPTIAKASKGYTAGKVSSVARKAGQAILATYQVDGASSAVTTKTARLDVERYVFWRNGKAVIVTLSSATGSDNVDPWKTVTDGFAWAG